VDEAEVFRRLGISLLLGLLVGLQRQHADSALAGLRTFPLVTLLGGLSALLADVAGGWAIAAGLLAMAVVIGVSNEIRSRKGDAGAGITTEVALLVMFLVGAYAVAGEHWLVAVAVGVSVAVLLQFKVELHGLVDRLGDADLRAVMTFALISGIILPVLPDRTFGPLDVLNPFEIWLMVVLIVGITLAGYACYKLFGRRAGLLLGGVLGGAISSTATVASYARRTRIQPEAARHALIVIGIASAVVFVRVLIEISAVSQRLLPTAIAPLAILGAATLLPALAAFIRAARESQPLPEQQNPTELKSALVFAAVYAAVTLALAAAKKWLGPQGLYLVAVLSGLTDMDAITLSTARLVEHADSASALAPRTAWRLIAVAAMSNLVFKGMMAAALGNRRLAGMVAAAFAVPLAVGAALIVAWPD
jgi:uncharacterized membrane protein (DUF4010 family)